MKILLLLLPLLSTPALAWDNWNNGDNGPAMLSDTADLTAYAPSANPDAPLIERARKSDTFLQGARYKSGLHLTEASASSFQGTEYRAAALLQAADGRLFYRKFHLQVGGFQRQVSILDQEDINLADMHFTVHTALLDRLVVVEDAANAVTLVFPLGVGGIDQGVISSNYRLLTPRLHHASLNRSTVVPALNNPTYYRKRPFMPISTSDGNVTGYAFHITILGDEEVQQYGLNYLVRGFESHGCMRLREKDLLEFFTIVEHGADAQIPVNIDYHVTTRVGAVQAVYPMNDTSFMQVTYFDDAPHYRRDEHDHLVIMERADGQPDFRRMGVSEAADFAIPEASELLDNSQFPMP